MRLTLRTLLAWLDDTLSPAEVREIGKQVAESPFAKELVERVHRVTRQRRLTVPSRSGPDATDPNVVASYLDNELPPEEVAEFEKRCLTSDVHLAEVASVHQILSLIGQKAKVPTEARHRMYHLIKGREAVAAKAPRASQATEPEPVSEPIQPWVTPEPPRRPWIEQFGPIAGVVLLIVAFCWSAWMSLSPSDSQSGKRTVALDAKELNRLAAEAQKAQARANEAAAAPVEPKAAAAPEADAEKPKEKEKEKEEPKSAPAEPAEAEKAASPRPDLPPGTLGVALKPSGVLLRYDSENRKWTQLTADTPLRDQDRLLSLDPFRSTLELGSARADLVGETEVWILPPQAKQAGRLNLVGGRVVLHGTTPPTPFVIQFAKKTVEITPPAGVDVGVERINKREPGATVASDPTLKILAPEAEVAVSADDDKQTLAGPGAITFDSRGSWGDVEKQPPPSWVTESKPTPFDVQIGEQFQRYFRPDREVLSNLVEAIEDDQKDVRRRAISSTRAIGGIVLVVPLLHQPENPLSRRAAIGVLRTHLAEGPEAAQELRNQLQIFFGDDIAARVEKLLVGFTLKESRDKNTYKQLVTDLSSPEVAIRELAIENLQSLTGRDNLGYDADRPDQGGGLKAWKDLDKNNELRPMATPEAEARPKAAATKTEK